MFGLIFVILAGIVIYYLVGAFFSFLGLVLLGLITVIFLITEGFVGKNTRAYRRVEVCSRLFATPIDIYRGIVFSRDPEIGDSEKEWARKQLEKLGRPIIDLPPRKQGLRIVR